MCIFLKPSQMGSTIYMCGENYWNVIPLTGCGFYCCIKTDENLPDVSACPHFLTTQLCQSVWWLDLVTSGKFKKETSYNRETNLLFRCQTDVLYSFLAIIHRNYCFKRHPSSIYLWHQLQDLRSQTVAVFLTALNLIMLIMLTWAIEPARELYNLFYVMLDIYTTTSLCSVHTSLRVSLCKLWLCMCSSNNQK